MPRDSGHQAILDEAWQRYGRPLAITEVHLGSTREEQMRWMLEAWDAAHSARRGGVDVRAVTAWALFGLTDWDSLVTRLDGHYEPGVYDIRGPQPRATALGSLLADLASGRSPDTTRARVPGLVAPARPAVGRSRIPTRIRMGFHRLPWRCVTARASVAGRF